MPECGMLGSCRIACLDNPEESLGRILDLRFVGPELTGLRQVRDWNWEQPVSEPQSALSCQRHCDVNQPPLAERRLGPRTVVENRLLLTNDFAPEHISHHNLGPSRLGAVRRDCEKRPGNRHGVDGFVRVAPQTDESRAALGWRLAAADPRCDNQCLRESEGLGRRQFLPCLTLGNRPQAIGI